MSTTKTKFLCLYRFAADAWPAKPSSPQEMQAQYAAWRAWMTQFEKELVPGDGLKPGPGAAAVVKGGNVTDGPFIEAKEVVASYSLIETSSLARAIEIIKACPIGMDPGASIEIRQLGGYSG
jgi:hypothetical protein